MEIKSLFVDDLLSSELDNAPEGLRHVKSLPCLSVVQATEGHYDFGLLPDKQQILREDDVFIAPAHKMQVITHHVSPRTGRMRAHWVFLTVQVNGLYQLEDVYDFPTVLPHEYSGDVRRLIDGVHGAKTLAEKLPFAYTLLTLLLRAGKPKPPRADETLLLARHLLETNAERHVSVGQVARQCGISVAGLYRKFGKAFSTTPSVYQNQYRLKRAAVLLETTDLPITQIALETGFCDQSYFSRQFRRLYRCAPGEYRARSLSAPGGVTEATPNPKVEN